MPATGNVMALDGDPLSLLKLSVVGVLTLPATSAPVTSSVGELLVPADQEKAFDS